MYQTGGRQGFTFGFTCRLIPVLTYVFIGRSFSGSPLTVVSGSVLVSRFSAVCQCEIISFIENGVTSVAVRLIRVDIHIFIFLHTFGNFGKTGLLFIILKH